MEVLRAMGRLERLRGSSSKFLQACREVESGRMV